MSSPTREGCSRIDDWAHYRALSDDGWLGVMDHHSTAPVNHAHARPLEDRFLEVLEAIHPTTWGQR